MADSRRTDTPRDAELNAARARGYFAGWSDARAGRAYGETAPGPCPECGGEGSIDVDSMTMVGVPGGSMPDRCPVCEGSGRRTDTPEAAARLDRSRVQNASHEWLVIADEPRRPKPSIREATERVLIASGYPAALDRALTALRDSTGAIEAAIDEVGTDWEDVVEVLRSQLRTNAAALAELDPPKRHAD